MENYLSIIETVLADFGVSIHMVAGGAVILVLLCLLAVTGSRRKAVKRVAALEKNQEQERIQLNEALQNAQSQADRAAALEQQQSQRQQQLTELLDALAKDFSLDTNAPATPDASPEDALWQRHKHTLTQLTNRLQTSEQNRNALEQSQQTTQSQLAEKETVITELKHVLDAQAGQITKLEQDMAEQQALMQQQQDSAEAGLAKLQAKNRSYKAYIGKLETGRMQVFNDLNLAAQKIHQLETGTKDKDNAELAELQAKNHAYKTHIDELELDRMKVFNDLNLAAQKIRQLETALKGAGNLAEPVIPEPLEQKEETQTFQHEEKPAEQLIEIEPTEEPKQSKPSFAKFVSAMGLGKPQPAEGASEEAQTLQESQPEEKSAEPITMEPAEETKPSGPSFSKVFSSLGLGKQQSAAAGNEEKAAEPVAMELEEESKPSGSSFSKVFSSLGLGKQQPAETGEEAQEALQAAMEIEPAETVKQSKPLFGKLIGSMVLGKPQTAADEEPEATQEVVEPEPVVQDEAAEKAKHIAGQLKNFYQKMTSSPKD